MKTMLIALTLTALGSFAVTANASTKEMPQVQDYTYSTRLDIAEVTKTPNLNFCGVRPVDLGYVDHSGTSHVLRYETTGNKCLGEN